MKPNPCKEWVFSFYNYPEEAESMNNLMMVLHGIEH